MDVEVAEGGQKVHTMDVAKATAPITRPRPKPRPRGGAAGNHERDTLTIVQHITGDVLVVVHQQLRSRAAPRNGADALPAQPEPDSVIDNIPSMPHAPGGQRWSTDSANHKTRNGDQ